MDRGSWWVQNASKGSSKYVVFMTWYIMLQLPPRFLILHLMQDIKQRADGISQHKKHHNDFKNGDDNGDVREKILIVTNAVPIDTRMSRDNTNFAQ